VRSRVCRHATPAARCPVRLHGFTTRAGTRAT
jgi:hypothetical protein